MYEDKYSVSIKFTNGGDTTVITVDKDAGHVAVEVMGHYSTSFECHPRDLQRIVDMLNYVIKLNQDENTNQGGV